MPFDVAEPTLRHAADSIAAAYPGLEVTGIVGDFRRHLPQIPSVGRRLFVLLGGTIGNFAPVERRAFLAALAATMRRGDALLLGTDLVKDPARLVAAYDDAAGVTAAFDRNVLAVLNDRLGADFDPHPLHPRRPLGRDQRVDRDAPALGGRPGRHAFRRSASRWRSPTARNCGRRSAPSSGARGVRRELRAAGLRPRRWWTDPAGDFALSLAMRS